MHAARKLWRKIKGGDRSHRKHYLQSSESPRLHLGSGGRILEGWLNTDLFPSNGVSHLDAIEIFPFEDATFQYIYCEHMIEHISFESAKAMAAECFRVLRPGGTLRVVTPNLDSVLAVRSTTPGSLPDQYLNWMSSTFTPEAFEPKSCFVVNAMFRLWGHEFIYDLATLTKLLESGGFNNVAAFPIQESSHPLLRNLANANRYPEGLLEFESLCVEATKSERQST